MIVARENESESLREARLTDDVERMIVADSKLSISFKLSIILKLSSCKLFTITSYCGLFLVIHIVSSFILYIHIVSCFMLIVYPSKINCRKIGKLEMIFSVVAQVLTNTPTLIPPLILNCSKAYHNQI